MQPPGAPAPLAEWWQRLVARIIDGVILGIVSFVVSFIMLAIFAVSYSSLDGSSSGFLPSGVVTALATIIVTAIWVAYEFFMLKMNGQTVGKLVMGIKVVPVGQGIQPGGLPVDMAFKRGAVTWGGWVISAIPLGLFSFLTALLAYAALAVNGASQLWDKPLQQTFADKISGTVVVKIK
ncbi:RDD family protein [Nonomuraea sp. B12E4]|uniref:RDD family protein n=1 Tax=Nonomuraea sp. B12E4 TaxID=3153564 RepID=UPI00325E48CA